MQEDIGILFRYIVRKTIDKVDDASGRAAFFRVAPGAGFTPAIPFPVVLRDRKDPALRIFPDPGAELLPRGRKNARVGKAELPRLWISRRERIILGMFLQIIFGRNQIEERMMAVEKFEIPAAFMRNRREGGV